MWRVLAEVAVIGLAITGIEVPTAAAPPRAAADRPPAERLHTRTVMPPGENGDFTTSEQAAYQADGDPSEFGPHVDDQREMYWHYRSKPGSFATPHGSPATPAPGVRIYRDGYGVPLVYGDTARDVWFGAGYAAATDRLFEIDAVRRTARGTLAELTGPDGVPDDLAVRTLTYTPHEYHRMLDRLPHDGQVAIRGYAAGVAQRINEMQADPSQLPAEYQLLQTTPADWSVVDTMAAGVYITRFVATQGGLEMDNIAALRALQEQYGRKRGVRAFAALFPDDNPAAVTTVEHRRFSNLAAGDRSAPDRRRAFHRAVRFSRTIPLSLAHGPGTGDAPPPQPSSGAATAATSLVRQATRSLEAWRANLHGGSFAYAVSGRRTADGHAMLSTNPQLDYSYPSLLYELEVHGGGYDARGIGVPGIPTVGIGHNAHVAWGLTTGYSKNIDSFIEHTRPGATKNDPPQYRYRGTWRDETCSVETIHYRQAPHGVPTGPPSFSKDYRICRTVHGPVVATAKHHTWARTVDYAQWKHDIDTVEGILAWDRARTLADVRAGVRKVAWNENIVAADDRGHIGYWHPGRYFRRPAGIDQRFPLDGRGAQDPRGLLPFRRMPHVVDPRDGYVVNWNTKPAHGWVDGDLSGSNARPGGRINRVVILQRLLRHGHDLRFADLMRIDRRAGEDDHAAPGYLPVLRRLRGTSGLAAPERTVLRLVSDWDGRAFAPGARGGSTGFRDDPRKMTDGPAATAFRAVRNAIVRKLFGDLPKIVLKRLDTLSHESHQYDATPMDNLVLRVLRAHWSGLPAPSVVTGPVNRTAVLRHALAAAVRQLHKRFGKQPSDWRRRHGISHISSLTGVIGPFHREPFEDRGTWVQHVAFTTGRPH